MVKYVSAKRGNRFILTELGFEQARVRGKFNSERVEHLKYRHHVPASWVEKGYVVEVKE